MNHETMGSKDAARMLISTPSLTIAERDVLVAAVTQSDYAAWVLVDAPGLTEAHRAVLREVAYQ